MNDSYALTESTYYILLSLITPQHGYGIMQRTEEMSQQDAETDPQYDISGHYGQGGDKCFFHCFSLLRKRCSERKRPLPARPREAGWPPGSFFPRPS